MKSINVEVGILKEHKVLKWRVEIFLWRVEFFKIGKRDLNRVTSCLLER